MKKSIFEKIFSVKNKDIHKVVTILGIKLKFKSYNLEISRLKEQLNNQQCEISLLNEQLNTLNILKRYIAIPPTKEGVEHSKESNSISVFVPTNFKKVGRYTYAQPELWVENPLESTIGSFCSIGRNVVIGHGDHPTTFLSTSPFFYLDALGVKDKNMVCYDNYYTHNLKGVEIGNDVWIGNGAFIKNGLKIGDGAVIGAQSVVTKDVPPFAIVVGSPAKVIKYRFTQEIIDDLLKLKWWDLDIEILKKVPYDNIEEALKYLRDFKEII